jgi:hypothetical protein
MKKTVQVGTSDGWATAVKKGVEGMRALVKRYGPRNVFIIGDVIGEYQIKQLEREAMILTRMCKFLTLYPPHSIINSRP